MLSEVGKRVRWTLVTFVATSVLFGGYFLTGVNFIISSVFFFSASLIFLLLLFRSLVRMGRWSHVVFVFMAGIMGVIAPAIWLDAAHHGSYIGDISGNLDRLIPFFPFFVVVLVLPESSGNIAIVISFVLNVTLYMMISSVLLCIRNIIFR